MGEPRQCPECGAELALDAPGGHCPRCLSNLGVASGEGPANPPPTITITPLPEAVPDEKPNSRRTLTVVNGAAVGTVLLLKEGTFRVGRSENNDYQIPDPTISGVHCELALVESGDLFVRDLGSTNGIFIAGRKTGEGWVKPGEILRLGSVDLVFESTDRRTIAPTVRLHEGEHGTMVISSQKVAKPTGPEPAMPSPIEDPTISFMVRGAADELKTRMDDASHTELVATFRPDVVLYDRYVLERELGRGGMGLVFRARDKRLDRPVAIKIIAFHGEQARAGSALSDGRMQAFEREALLGASLNHPAIATVFDYGFHEGKPFTVFEYIEGESLDQFIKRRKRIPLDEVRLILAPLAQGLDFVHSRHIVHRDLKPANIRATTQGSFKILDLGLANQIQTLCGGQGFAGTPAYASPEQAAELPLDGRTDQYALALIVYEMVTGALPFRAATCEEMLRLHIEAEPPPPVVAADKPEAVRVSTALLRALQKNPSERFASCDEFAVALGCQVLSSTAPVTPILPEAEIRCGQPGKLTRRRHIALLTDTLWCDQDGEIERWPLRQVTGLRRFHPRRMELEVSDSENGRRQRFIFYFATDYACKSWLKQLGAQRQATQSQETLQPAPFHPISVVLLCQRPNLPLQSLGPVNAVGESRAARDAALRIRAASMGAHAVMAVQHEKLVMRNRTVVEISGIAIRATDLAGKTELQARWFRERVSRLTQTMFGLLAASLLLTQNAGAIIGRGLGVPNVNSHVSFLPFWWLAEAAKGRKGDLSLLLFSMAYYSWALLLSLLLRLLGWPQLVWATAVSLATATALPVFEDLAVRLVYWVRAYYHNPAFVQGPGSFLGMFSLTTFLPALAVYISSQMLAINMCRVRKGYLLAMTETEEHPRHTRRWVAAASLSVSLAIVAVSVIAYASGIKGVLSDNALRDRLRRLPTRTYKPDTFPLNDIGASWLLDSGWQEDPTHAVPGVWHQFIYAGGMTAAAEVEDTQGLPLGLRWDRISPRDLQMTLLYRMGSFSYGILTNFAPLGEFRSIKNQGDQWLEMEGKAEFVKTVSSNSPIREPRFLLRVHCDSVRQVAVMVLCPAELWEDLKHQIRAAANGFHLTSLPIGRVLERPAEGHVSIWPGNKQDYKCHLPGVWRRLLAKDPCDLLLTSGKGCWFGVWVKDFGKFGEERYVSVQVEETKLEKSLSAVRSGFEKIGSEDVEVDGHRGRLLRFHCHHPNGQSEITAISALFVHSGWLYQIQAETTNPPPANLSLLEEAVGGFEFPRNTAR